MMSMFSRVAQDDHLSVWLCHAQMHDLDKARRTLEATVAEQRVQIEELEDQVQVVEDAKLRLEVNMNAMQEKFKSEQQSREEQQEESKRSLVRQVR